MLADSHTWWTDDRIQAAVTSEYIHQQLIPEKQELLKQSVSFGDGLTDNTYLDYILAHAKRFFLILRHIGVPEQIFSLIDESYDDEDLPITTQAVKNLRLSHSSDRSLDRKFYTAQFKYLFRDIRPGQHIHFLDGETIPVKRLGPASGIGRSARDGFEKVQLASRVNHIYGRKRVVLDEPPDHLTEAEILSEINYAKKLTNDHVLSIYGSYSEGNSIYILLTPAIEYTLSLFVNSPPKHFENLPKSLRREILVNWPHCLANGLAWLHSNHRHHGALRPSNILIDNAYGIYLGQIDGLTITHGNTKISDLESYQYAAPERWKRAATMQTKAPAMFALHSGGRTSRKANSSQRISLGSAGDAQEDSISAATSTSHGLPIDMSTPTSTTYPFIPTSKGPAPRAQVKNADGFEYAASFLSSHSSGTQPGRLKLLQLPGDQPGHLSLQRAASTASAAHSAVSSHSSGGGQNLSNPMSHSVTLAPSEVRTAVVQTWHSAQFDPYAADIFSLGAIVLDIITFLCKRSSAAFSRHRSAKNRLAGRGGGVADASFHSNLGQVFSWSASLEADAEKKASKDECQIFQAVGPVIEVARECLARSPELRPEAVLVEKSLERCIRRSTSSGTAHCSFSTRLHAEQVKNAGSSRRGPVPPPKHFPAPTISEDQETGTEETCSPPPKARSHSVGWESFPIPGGKLYLTNSSESSLDFDLNQEKEDSPGGDAKVRDDILCQPGNPAAHPNDDTMNPQPITDRVDRLRSGADISSSIHTATDTRVSPRSPRTQPSSTAEAELRESFYQPDLWHPSLLAKHVHLPSSGGAVSSESPTTSPVNSNRLRSPGKADAAPPEQKLVTAGTASQRPRETDPHSTRERSVRGSGTDTRRRALRTTDMGGGRVSVSTLASNSSTIQLSWQKRDVSPVSPLDTNTSPDGALVAFASDRFEDQAKRDDGDIGAKVYSRDSEKQRTRLGRTVNLPSVDGAERHWPDVRGPMSRGGESKGTRSTESTGTKRAWLQTRYPMLGGRTGGSLWARGVDGRHG